MFLVLVLFSLILKTVFINKLNETDSSIHVKSQTGFFWTEPVLSSAETLVGSADGGVDPRHAALDLPRHQDPGNFRGEGLRHLSAAHIGDAVQGQVHEGGVPAGEVVLDGVVDQSDQVAVGVHQH